MTPHGLGLFPFVPANPLSRSHKLEDFFQLTPHPSSRLNLTLSVASGTSEAHVRCTIALKARRSPVGQRCELHWHKPWWILDWKDLLKFNRVSDLNCTGSSSSGWKSNHREARSTGHRGNRSNVRPRRHEVSCVQLLLWTENQTDGSLRKGTHQKVGR